ncbi:hypothetical protein F4821DRAFT_256228 [Hypoxylon rubiginosum]|uniref:Uncharacterized protein n=1 Tax=Hypoxylon rubiginosum TaxID=110542 RepID=A0ACC0DBP6_9PEZI|nr:hypothetical protein F4821DRAFT_256228 [Hypoxylon rubiginosum]
MSSRQDENKADAGSSSTTYGSAQSHQSSATPTIGRAAVSPSAHPESRARSASAPGTPASATTPVAGPAHDSGAASMYYSAMSRHLPRRSAFAGHRPSIRNILRRIPGSEREHDDLSPFFHPPLLARSNSGSLASYGSTASSQVIIDDHSSEHQNEDQEEDTRSWVECIRYTCCSICWTWNTFTEAQLRDLVKIMALFVVVISTILALAIFIFFKYMV